MTINYFVALSQITIEFDAGIIDAMVPEFAVAVRDYVATAKAKRGRKKEGLAEIADAVDTLMQYDTDRKAAHWLTHALAAPLHYSTTRYIADFTRNRKGAAKFAKHAPVIQFAKLLARRLFDYNTNGNELVDERKTIGAAFQLMDIVASLFKVYEVDHVKWGARTKAILLPTETGKQFYHDTIVAVLEGDAIPKPVSMTPATGQLRWTRGITDEWVDALPLDVLIRFQAQADYVGSQAYRINPEFLSLMKQWADIRKAERTAAWDAWKAEQDAA